MDDGRIVDLTEAAGRGDRAAVEALLVHYLPELRAFVRLRAGPLIRARESGSDLVQSVCRELLTHMDGFRHPGESAFKRWLYTATLRKITGRRDFLLAQKREVLREVAPESPRADESADLLGCYASFSTPSRHAMIREEVERIERAFEELPEDYREVITLAHIVGLSRAEIAEQMGRSEGAVRVLLHRAKAQVARMLRDSEPE